jgi:hypothetical protein
MECYRPIKSTRHALEQSLMLAMEGIYMRAGNHVTAAFGTEIPVGCLQVQDEAK